MLAVIRSRVNPHQRRKRISYGELIMLSKSVLVLNSLIIILVYQFGVAVCRPLDDKSLSKEEIVRQGNAFSKAKSGREAAHAYEQFFKQFGTAGIKALKEQSNESFALRAAWEEVRLTVDEKRSELDVLVNAQVLNRFLGFLEGRLRRNAPDWWQDLLLRARAFGRDNIVFLGKCAYYHKAGLGFHGPRDTSVEKVDGGFLLKIGMDSVSIPKVVIDEGEKHSGPCISAVCDSHSCFVAIHGQACFPYTLFRVDRETGTVQWKTRVWAEGELIGGYGPTYHCTALILEKERILVFGAGTCLYVEAFDPKNGKDIFRFSTSY